MSRARKLYLAFSLLALLGLANACKKDPPPPPEPTGPPKIFLTNQILDYIYQPEGTVMIYEDTLSCMLDTLTYTESSKDTITWVLAQDPTIILYYEEFLSLRWYRSSNKRMERLYTSACLPHNNKFCISLWRIGYGQNSITQFPWEVGKSFPIESSTGSHSIIDNFYPSIQIGNTYFEDVYLLRITRDPTEGLEMQMQNVDYYFARHIGVAAKIEYGANRHWVLKAKY